jgi:hypothetical protein
MKKSALMMCLLMSAAAFAAPASANWFARPGAGINLNVGSAPNPTPADLRALYGPSRYAYAVITPEVLRDMEGKAVYGENGEMLGVIATVDLTAGLVALHTTNGKAVALDADLLVNQRDRVIAPTLSMTEVMVIG